MDADRMIELPPANALDRAIIEGRAIRSKVLKALGYEPTGIHFAYRFMRDQQVELNEILDFHKPEHALDGVFCYAHLQGRLRLARTLENSFRTGTYPARFCLLLEWVMLSHRHRLYNACYVLGRLNGEGRLSENEFTQSVLSLHPFLEMGGWFVEDGQFYLREFVEGANNTNGFYLQLSPKIPVASLSELRELLEHHFVSYFNDA
ncbi:MAG: hypothetical protein M5U26_28240 [Planctomycetota bacterium]|nr:hypothetical protein [Planctomycetota bacterium]